MDGDALYAGLMSDCMEGLLRQVITVVVYVVMAGWTFVERSVDYKMTVGHAGDC